MRKPKTGTKTKIQSFKTKVLDTHLSHTLPLILSQQHYSSPCALFLSPGFLSRNWVKRRTEGNYVTENTQTNSLSSSDIVCTVRLHPPDFPRLPCRCVSSYFPPPTPSAPHWISIRTYHSNYSCCRCVRIHRNFIKLGNCFIVTSNPRCVLCVCVCVCVCDGPTW